MTSEAPEGYPGKRAAEIASITYRQLDYWARTGLVRPSLQRATGSGSRRLYSYRDLLELGRQAGVKPAMEYISFFGSVSRLDQARRIVEEANDPDATVIIDSFHTWNSGGDIEELRGLPAERISHFHIDDADPEMPAGTQADPNRVMPGDGPIDLEGEISILREIGYEGTVSLELFNPGLWEKDPAEVLAVGIERMRGLLG